tara:strand:+ start:1260 stop:1907 length:648 start_codon:yes stop_codon:yes gene_type:complete
MFSKKFILWLVPKILPPKFFSEKELNSCSKLLESNKNKYLHSRSFIREAMSDILDLNPQSVPLEGEFGKIPSIPSKYGYISLSHCDNALLIGWSTEKLGVDIEKINRKFNAKKIMMRNYFEDEINKLKLIKNKEEFRMAVLKLWVLKESSIKLQGGSIAKDLLNWQINLSEKISQNKYSGLKFNSYCFRYKDWYLGMATQNINLDKSTPFICDMF